MMKSVIDICGDVDAMSKGDKAILVKFIEDWQASRMRRILMRELRECSVCHIMMFTTRGYASGLICDLCHEKTLNPEPFKGKAHLRMTRAQYQDHFIASYGARWKSMSVEKKADEWCRCMKNRNEVGLVVWSNPWRYEKDGGFGL